MESLKVIAWNPNGIRALFKKNPQEVQRLVGRYSPDIIIFNETKGNSDHVLSTEKQCDSVIPGFNWYWNDNSIAKGRHGCVIAVKKEINLLSVNYGFDETKEPEGRIIAIETESCFIVGLYAVNAASRLEYKIEWMNKLTNYLEKLKKSGKTVIAAGDWNVAPEECDLTFPRVNTNTAGFTKQERDCFRCFLRTGWVDVFRHLYPTTIKYTFWSPMNNARARDIGWRLDHVVMNKEAITPRIKCEILDDFIGSDHCPIYISL
jgi:exodeoxyribonuclease III